MREASARILAGGRPVHQGTAWRFAPSYALTAAHCVGIRETRQITHPAVQLEFKKKDHRLGEPVPAKVARYDFDLDVALLRIEGAEDAGAICQPVAMPPPLDDDALAPRARPAWEAYAYPLAMPTGMKLDGSIDALDALDDQPALQLGCSQGGYGSLKLSSGAAIRVSGFAVAVLRWGPPALLQSVVYATPLDAVAERFPELAERMRMRRPSPPEPREGPGYLDCDRDDQWEALSRCLRANGDQAMFLYGRDGEAHEYFVERLHKRPPKGVDVDVAPVAWQSGGPPAHEEDFLAAVAKALATDPSQLARELSGRERKLLLVHPVLDLDLDIPYLDAVSTYYTSWLPALLGRERGRSDARRRGVALLQPLRWNGGARDLVRGPCRTGRRRALAFVKKMKGGAASSRLEIALLPELRPIGEAQLRPFLERAGVTAANLDRIVARARGLRSQDLFELLKGRVP